MLYYRDDITIGDATVALFQLMDWYQKKELIFPDMTIGVSGKQALAREAIDALLYGIPYPHVYVSETQHGDYLVLEADNRLRCLIEFIAGKFPIDMSGLLLGNEEYYRDYYLNQFMKFEELDSRYRQDILRSRIQLCIIDYNTPLHIHMRIGSYIGNWTVYQEEAIRRKMYSYKGYEMLTQMLQVSPRTKSSLLIESELVAFLTHVYSFVLNDFSSVNMDKYYMQEKMILSLNDNCSEFSKLAEVYQTARLMLSPSRLHSKYGVDKTSLFRIFELRYKQFKHGQGHLLGIAACVCKNLYDIERIVRTACLILEKVCDSGYDRELALYVKNCDLSSHSVFGLIKVLERVL